jgi:hypothetical protein
MTLLYDTAQLTHASMTPAIPEQHHSGGIYLNVSTYSLSVVFGLIVGFASSLFWFGCFEALHICAQVEDTG